MAFADNSLSQLTVPQRHLWDNEFDGAFPNEKELVAAAVALGADAIKPWSEQELSLVRGLQNHHPIRKTTLALLRDLIFSGRDPLGEAFCALRTPVERREDGATYMPSSIIGAMMDWAVSQKNLTA